MSGYRNKKGWRASVSSMAMGAALGVALMVAQPALAVETTSALQGHVASAPAGSKVLVVNVDNGSKATVMVREDGSYSVVGLRPGNYQVSFKTPDGKVVRQDITLVVGETTELNGDMAQATQEVVVVARRKEVKTSEVSTNVSRSTIENLPQNDRNFLNFAALAPGVTTSLDPERKTFQSGATTANMVNVFIDGQSQKNQILQGGALGQDASRGDPFPLLAVQEFKVSTQNYKAEYEQAGSAIISAITKSGTNEFHGDVFYQLRDKSMSGQPYYDRKNNVTKPNYNRKQWGVDLGGPIIKDTLFFYVAHEETDEVRPSDTVSMPTTSSGISSSLASGLASAYNGTFAKGFNEKQTFAKLTWTPDDHNTVDFSLTQRTETDDRNFGGTTAYSAGSSLDQYVKEGVLSWKYRDENLLNEVSLESQSYHWRQSPLGGGNNAIYLVLDAAHANNVIAQFGGPNYSQEKAQDNFTFKDNVTITGLEWHGQHKVKVGVKMSSFKLLADENWRPQFYYDASTYVIGGTNKALYAKVSDGQTAFNDSNMQLGAFIQDDWTYNQNWSFNLGIRWDYETNMLNSDYTTPSDIATALRNYGGWAAAGINPEDYISDGNNRTPFAGAFQPRLGFSYDVNGDSQTVIFGGYGRYYDRTIHDAAQLETRRALVHSNIQIDFDTSSAATSSTLNDMTWVNGLYDNADPVIAFAKAQGIRGEVFAINKDVKVPYSDMFNIGVRHKFGNIDTSVTLAKIESHDLFSWVLGNRVYGTGTSADGKWCSYGGQYACQPWAYGLNGYGNLLISDNSKKASYNAIYLTAEKPYSKADGYSWYVKMDLNDAKANGMNDLFNFDFENPAATGMHPAEGVSKVVVYATGRYDLPWDIRLDATLNYRSGTPQDQWNVGTAPEQHVVSAYWGKQAYKQVDMRLAKDFTLPNGSTITAELQGINIFDYVNRTYSVWGDGGGGLNAPWHAATHQPDKATQGPPRQFTVGLKYKW